MTKHKDQQIKPGTRPGRTDKRDLSDLKAMLAKVTFKGAKKGYHIPPRATDEIGMAAAAYQTEHTDLNLNQCLTLAFMAYWELYEER